MRGRPSASGPVRALFAVTVALAALAAPVMPVAPRLGVQSTGIISAGGPPVAAGKATNIIVYLMRGSKLAPAVRPGLPGHPYLGLTQLGVPVTSEERRKGLRTEVPRDWEMHIRQDGEPGELTVDLIEEPARGDGGFSHWSRAALAQLACTAETVPGVERVVLAGLPNKRHDYWTTVTCEDFDDLLV
ncbi:hypothetical protein E1264_18140 [Actinomadura sp. KC216]|uniref:hypothetical protein n=1 Tax=Actinomadura sp. KC216 TaxID=2530370 RepID=UPI0010504ED7|nr:hypothetical protein [Actinomadura sp. KC216]TDB86359.1 hypothetical protein E1264_18140 [Actinomadura sp. KC216]